MDDPATEMIHASLVAFGPSGVLILGGSGAGKSTLALGLMAQGARLVADDRVCLRREGAALMGQAPEALRGVIEARGMGLLRAPIRLRAQVALVVDLDRVEPDRLPPRREITLLGVDLPLCLRVDGPQFLPGLRFWALNGREA